MNLQHLVSFNQVLKQITKVVLQEAIRSDGATTWRGCAGGYRSANSGKEAKRSQGLSASGSANGNNTLFQLDHLLALCELALRESANWIDGDLAQTQSGARERMLACLRLNRGGEHVLRSPIHLAKLLDLELIGKHMQPYRKWFIEIGK